MEYIGLITHVVSGIIGGNLLGGKLSGLVKTILGAVGGVGAGYLTGSSGLDISAIPSVMNGEEFNLQGLLANAGVGLVGGGVVNFVLGLFARGR